MSNGEWEKDYEAFSEAPTSGKIKTWLEEQKEEDFLKDIFNVLSKPSKRPPDWMYLVMPEVAERLQYPEMSRKKEAYDRLKAWGLWKEAERRTEKTPIEMVEETTTVPYGERVGGGIQPYVGGEIVPTGKKYPKPNWTEIVKRGGLTESQAKALSLVETALSKEKESEYTLGPEDVRFRGIQQIAKGMGKEPKRKPLSPKDLMEEFENLTPENSILATEAYLRGDIPGYVKALEGAKRRTGKTTAELQANLQRELLDEQQKNPEIIFPAPESKLKEQLPSRLWNGLKNTGLVKFDPKTKTWNTKGEEPLVKVGIEGLASYEREKNKLLAAKEAANEMFTDTQLNYYYDYIKSGKGFPPELLRVGFTPMGNFALNRAREYMSQRAKEEGITGYDRAFAEAQYKGFETEIRTNARMKVLTSINEAMLVKNINLLEQQNMKMVRTKYPALNSIFQAYQRGTGDKDIIAFMQSLWAVAVEAAKIRAGALGIAEVSVGAQKIMNDWMSATRNWETLDTQLVLMRAEAGHAKFRHQKVSEEIKSGYYQQYGKEASEYPYIPKMKEYEFKMGSFVYKTVMPEDVAKEVGAVPIVDIPGVKNIKTK